MERRDVVEIALHAHIVQAGGHQHTRQFGGPFGSHAKVIVVFAVASKGRKNTAMIAGRSSRSA
jgi:hypothetical protein